jgi:hypothetical protein
MLVGDASTHGDYVASVRLRGLVRDASTHSSSRLVSVA